MTTCCSNSPTVWALGFQTEAAEEKMGFNCASSDHTLSNIMKVVSWIPLFCIISAIYHRNAAKAYESMANHNIEGDSNLEEYVSGLRIRAIAEFCQASVFLALIDIIVSIGRYCCCCSKGT